MPDAADVSRARARALARPIEAPPDPATQIEVREFRMRMLRRLGKRSSRILPSPYGFLMLYNVRCRAYKSRYA